MTLVQLYGTVKKTCLDLPPKITAEVDLHDMTFSEIESLIWRGIGVSTHISLKDRLTEEALALLVSHPLVDTFPVSFKYWLWDALDTMYEEQAA